jgi:hypothetical protein
MMMALPVSITVPLTPGGTEPSEPIPEPVLLV